MLSAAEVHSLRGFARLRLLYRYESPEHIIVFDKVVTLLLLLLLIMGTRTMHCTLEGPANALAINRDATQVAVAGRNVFKVFSLENEEFHERINLRVGKNLNLNFSCSDVVWNMIEDHILATAATNGAVVTWNLNKSSRSKQDMIYQDHKRTVNKVCFHPSEAHILLSGSQDGTMKSFDIRKREAANTFLSSSESVRDVQFCPHTHYMFAAVQENGNVQLWDMRRTDKCERQFTAHSGPVFTCDWHPEEKRFLATGGRDKAIKIWDLSCYKPLLHQCIQTIASVAHIKWRPQKKYHIANSSLVVDCTINVWDTRRPYVPFAAFTEHKDVATGFAWRNSPSVLLSTSKDSTLFQHVMDDATRPATHADALSVAHVLNPSGDLAFASSDRFFGEQANRSRAGPTYPAPARFQGVFKKAANPGDKFSHAQSTLCIFVNNDVEFLSLRWLQDSALRYQLSGRPFGELCERNSLVAADLGRPDVAQTWRLLKALYAQQAAHPADFLGLLDASARGGGDAERSSQEGSNFHTSRHNSGNTRNRQHSGGKKPVVGGRHLSGGSALDRGSQAALDAGTQQTTGGEDSASSGIEDDQTLTYIASGMANTPGDFLFGDDSEAAAQAFYSLQGSGACAGDGMPLQPQEWPVPNEAFEPRHAIRDSPPMPDLGHPQSSPTSGDEDEGGPEAHHYGGGTCATEAEDQAKVLTVVRPFCLPAWNAREVVPNLLTYYVDQGDVQMAVSATIVLGDKLKGCIEEATLESWFLAYIDLLSRFQMWNVIARVLSLSSLPSVSTLNQQSTLVHTLCGGCQKPLTRSGWLCDRCKAIPAPCAICHEVVRGLFVWCQGCAHGGHLKHVSAWFSKQRFCPAGCGHVCEYT